MQKVNNVQVLVKKSLQVIKISLEQNLPCDVSPFLSLVIDYLHPDAIYISGQPRDASITSFSAPQGSTIELKSMTVTKQERKRNGDHRYELFAILSIPSDLNMPMTTWGYLPAAENGIFYNQVPVQLSLTSRKKGYKKRRRTDESSYRDREVTKQIKTDGHWGSVLYLPPTFRKRMMFNNVHYFSPLEGGHDILLLGHENCVFIESRNKPGQFTSSSHGDHNYTSGTDGQRCWPFLDVWWKSYQKLVAPHQGLESVVLSKQREVIFSFFHDETIYSLSQACFLGHNHQHLVLGDADGLYGINLQTRDLTQIAVKQILRRTELPENDKHQKHFLDFAVDGNTIYLLVAGTRVKGVGYFILSIHVSTEDEQGYTWTRRCIGQCYSLSS